MSAGQPRRAGRAASTARRRWLAAVLAVGTSWVLPAVSWAQAYSVRPITLVVSFEPGGSTDLSARVVAQELTRLLGQQVVVENRVGAGGRIGTKSVALAKPDGYTLLWGSGSTLTAAPVLFADQGHVATLVPVSLGATQPPSSSSPRRPPVPAPWRNWWPWPSAARVR